MNVNDLKPAKAFALQFGCKAVLYGKPGSGKTPVAAKTSPRPVLLASEPGMLTLRDSECPTFPAFSPARVDEFMLWFKGSNEAKGFDTLIWDSASEAAEKFITTEMGSGTSKAGNEQHGMRIYGKMARWMYDHLSSLYYMERKHIILISKMERLEVNGSIYHRPYFPGKQLPVQVPHLFDLVTCLGDWNIPNVPNQSLQGTKAFRTFETFDYMGRDRSGRLSEYEPPDFSKIIAKVLS